MKLKDSHIDCVMDTAGLITWYFYGFVISVVLYSIYIV